MSAHDLEGFVVYQPTRAHRIGGCAITLIPAGKTILSKGAVEALGDPEAVNLFFDDRKGRLMIKKAEPTYPNMIHLSRQRSNRSFNQINAWRHAMELAGADGKTSVRCAGYAPKGTENTLIFDLRR